MVRNSALTHRHAVVQVHLCNGGHAPRGHVPHGCERGAERGEEEGEEGEQLGSEGGVQ